MTQSVSLHSPYVVWGWPSQLSQLQQAVHWGSGLLGELQCEAGVRTNLTEELGSREVQDLKLCQGHLSPLLGRESPIHVQSGC